MHKRKNYNKEAKELITNILGEVDPAAVTFSQSAGKFWLSHNHTLGFVIVPLSIDEWKLVHQNSTRR